ncbi:synaptic vesicle 2-related protein [Plakobranchus ocellatus]|uniref:Synaptic vesicle 2-related protein n=1 Tax=Plakobranchus ocellatus TaxID=259542 RepID=A0AAV4AWH9_9GAST|nr:synaptic vesicle 2-related protein [Plakobranchus ocellatus]
MMSKKSLTQSKQGGYRATLHLDVHGSDSLENEKEVENHVVEYTIQEAIDHSGFGWFQIKLSIVAGITWMADSMEIMLLSILGPVLSCQWYLEAWEQALLTTLVMVGMASGSSFWGYVSDKHGRKTALMLASSLIGYFGILSAFSPMYLWMAMCRFLVGCCLAALPQTVTLYSEYLPTQSRGAGIMFLEVSFFKSEEIFFAIGAAVEVTLAMIVMPRLGWRYLMAFSAIPVLFFPILGPWLPESARFLLTCGHRREAVAMLERVAKDNGKTMLKGKLSSVDLEGEERGSFKGLYKPSIRKLTCLLNALWFLLGFSYYGMALLLPTLLNKPDGCHGTDIEVLTKNYCSVKCSPFTYEDYVDLAITSFADAPGYS